jgi:hypothetical protein
MHGRRDFLNHLQCYSSSWKLVTSGWHHGGYDRPTASSCKAKIWMPLEQLENKSAMRSLMDDTSTDESTNHVLSPTNPHGVSLLDTQSSSVSAASYSPGQQSRVSFHMQKSDPFHFNSDQDSASLNTGSSSIRVGTGVGNQNTAGRPVGGAVSGARQVGNGLAAHRHNLTM